MFEATASINFSMGDFNSLEGAHLTHDIEANHENKNIRHDKTHLNTVHEYQPIDAYVEENFERPIQEADARKIKKGKHKSCDGYYEDYFNRREQNKNRGDKDKSPARLMVAKYGDEDVGNIIVEQFVSQGVPEDEVLKAMGDGINNWAFNFNKECKHLKLAKWHTHVNERGAAHLHGNALTYGTDSRNMPYTDMTNALRDEFGKYKDPDEYGYKKDGKMKVKSNAEVMKEARAKWDRELHESVNKSLTELAKTRGVDFTPPTFIRKTEIDPETETGRSHNYYQEVERQAEKLAKEKINSYKEQHKDIFEKHEEKLNEIKAMDKTIVAKKGLVTREENKRRCVIKQSMSYESEAEGKISEGNRRIKKAEQSEKRLKEERAKDEIRRKADRGWVEAQKVKLQNVRLEQQSAREKDKRKRRKLEEDKQTLEAERQALADTVEKAAEVLNSAPEYQNKKTQYFRQSFMYDFVKKHRPDVLEDAKQEFGVQYSMDMKIPNAIKRLKHHDTNREIAGKSKSTIVKE